MGRVFGKQKEMEAGYKKIKGESKKAGEEQKNSFGASQLAMLKNYALGFFTITAAIGAVTKSFGAMRAARDAALERGKTDESGMSQLAQLADTPEQMDALIARAKKIHAAGSTETMDQAARLVFSVESASMGEFEQLFADLAGKKLVTDPAIFARAAATLLATLGEEETGGVRAITSKAFAASTESPAEAEALLEAGARGGSFAKELGISDEEVMAATAVTATATGSAELGGTQVASLLKSLNVLGGFNGKSLRESIEQLTPDGREFSALKDDVGRTEAISAMLSIKNNLEKYERALSKQEIAQREDLVGAKLQLAEQVPELAAQQQLRRAKNQRELAETNVQTMAALAEAATNSFRENQLREKGTGFYGQFSGALGGLSASALQTVAGDQAFLRLLQKTGYGTVEDPELRKAIDERLAAPQTLPPAAPKVNEGAYLIPPEFDAIEPKAPAVQVQGDAAALQVLNQIAGIMSDLNSKVGNQPGRTVVGSRRGSQLGERYSEVA